MAALAWTIPAASLELADVCPKLSTPVIEILNFTDRGTVIGAQNRITSYASKVCSLPRVSFPGPEAVYKVVLHAGNRIGFDLSFPPACHLMMAFVRTCDSGNSCLSNSPGSFRGVSETIKPVSYPEGTYYLYIDSLFPEPCPSYTLSATGVNPTPDLVLGLTSPAKVTAGQRMTYTFTIRNRGKLAATRVEVNQALPPGVTYSGSSAGCTRKGSLVTCRVDRLAVNESMSGTITVMVNSDTRKSLTGSASAKAAEGGPSNKASITTPVNARSDLALESSSPASAVAGTSTTYTLTLRNDGPSDATRILVTDNLPPEMVFATGSPGCSNQGSRVTCTIDRLKAHSSTTRSITVNVKPTASGPLSHVASVSAVEPDPKPLDNSTTITTEASRQTDLAITKTGPDPARRAAGESLVYQIAVENKGPSDSTGATITDHLPAGLTFSASSDCTSEDGRTVTCELSAIPAGDSRTASFEALIDSSLERTTLSNEATVVGNETDPIEANNRSNAVETLVMVEADLLVQSVTATRIPWIGIDSTGTVKAGENLLYTVSVSNGGPSDSRGGYIQDRLPGGLAFVSSPDGCSLTGRTVTCPIPGLKKGEEAVRRFVVGIASSVTEAIGNEVCVISQVAEHDLHGENDCSSDTIKVEREADLSVALTDSPDAVLIANELTYTLSVKNAGPSDAAAVIADLTLPPGASFVEASDCYERQAEPGVVRCELGDVVAGHTESRSIKALAPGERGAFVAKADVHAGTTDPNAMNDHVEETTTVANPEDADLVLAKTVDATTAVAGQLLRYELTLANQGFAGTGEVALSVDDELPEGVTFVAPESSPACMETGTGITCEFDPLDPGARQLRTLTVRVEPTATGSLVNTADISQNTVEAVHDPNLGNNHASVEVPVLQTAPLVLPFFEVNADTSNPTTLFTLKNPSETNPLEVRYDVFLAGLPPAPISGEVNLSPKETRTVNLLELSELQGKGLQTGHVGITPATEKPALAGDFIHFDPSQGSASGERLISTDTSRTPPELCQSWSVRFLRGLPAGSSTDLLFFVPGNSGGVVATGKVFAESGAFVQNVEISSGMEAFRVTINVKDDGGLPLLAGSGAIEWSFRDGLVGNVTAVHRLRDSKDKIAVPGFCRSHHREGGVSLVLPFFEVDRSREAGLTTLLAFRNETDETVEVQPVVHFQEAEAPAERQADVVTLNGHGIQTLNLRDVLDTLGLETVSQGYVTLEADPPAVLSGDFIRVGPEGRSGAALGSSQLCRHWDVRFVQDIPAGSNTSFLFYLQDGGAPTGTAYNEGGQFLSDVSIPGPTFPSFLVPASGLGLSGSGSVEWDLGDGATGYVAMLLTGKAGEQNYSVLIPGACR
jgi:uncharacterized repeat protein (TIGR01451 family)